MRAPEGGKYITVRRGHQLIRADYWGGPYIDLTFGSEGYNPIEVINVWDYETDKAEPPLDTWDQPGPEKSEALRSVVTSWMLIQDEEWPEWYEGYLENARY
jgi:hypothetical protein